MSETIATVPAVPAQPYRVVIPGADGAGDEVFEAATQEELIDKLRIAKGNATEKIRQDAQERARLESELRAAQPKPPAQADGEKFDQDHYFRLLSEDPLEAHRYALSFVFDADIEDLKEDYRRVRTAAALSVQDRVNAAFVRKHPELLQVSSEDDVVNTEAIQKILTENGWKYTVQNLDAAYALAREQGRVKLPKSSAPPAPAAETAPVPSVLPGRPSAPTPSESDEEKFLRSAPLDKVREYLEKKHAAGLAAQ